MRHKKINDTSVVSDFHFQGQEEIDIDHVALKTYDKQGHICCHCCCDTRRATIIMNSITLLLCFLGIVVIWIASNNGGTIDEMFVVLHQDGLEDDDLESDVDFLIENYAWTLYTFWGVCMVFAILGIEGARGYRPWMVLMCASWYFIQGLASLVIFGWGGLGILVTGIWAYPTVMLYQEQREGIISEENYVNEIYSCCCLPNPERKITVREAIEKRLGIFS